MSGKLRILINLRGYHSLEKVSDVIASMLKKLQDGIRLGALTTKGFGLVTVEDLNAGLYDFHNKADVTAWLQNNAATKKILPLSEKNSANPKDFIVDADFAFNSSFIIRDYDVSAEDKKKSISAVTLKSREDFVIPGTSLKGILRHRVEYIFGKLGGDAQALENLMGCSLKNGEKLKSRFIVSESYVAPANFTEVEHRRNKIDRLTGGTLQGLLFATKPAYRKNSKASTFKLHFEIRATEDYEAGLAIFLLRDLWLGRVTIGGDKAELENFTTALKKFAGGDGL